MKCTNQFIGSAIFSLGPFQLQNVGHVLETLNAFKFSVQGQGVAAKEHVMILNQGLPLSFSEKKFKFLEMI